MARVRSPNYPQISLPAALERVAKIFDKAHQHRLEKADIAKLWGSTGQSGSFLGAVSALLKYKLLEQEGSTYRVTELAVTILHPSSDAEKFTAIKVAITSPALFGELFDEFGLDDMPSDEVVHSYLVRNGFAQSAASSVISVLRDSMAMVSSAASKSRIAPVTGSLALTEQPDSLVSTGTVVSGELRAMGRPQAQIKIGWEGDILRVNAILTDQFQASRLISLLTANMTLLPVHPEEAELKAPPIWNP